MSAPKDPIKNLEWRNNISAANIGKQAWNKDKPLSETHCENLKKAKKGVWSGKNNPFFGKTHSDLSIKRMKESHKGQIAWNKGISPSEKLCNQISETLKKRCSDPEIRKRLKEQATGIYPSEETRLKLIESHLDGGFWYGNVRYDDKKYCELFNDEFKERVRSFFAYSCLECETPQNGTKLCVHHVHYDKKTCCKKGEDVKERRFVALCKSCHSKTNKNRENWEQHFTNIINEYYGGKCYFTREESISINEGG